MNTCEPAEKRIRPSSPLAFRARGCVVLEEPRAPEESAAKKEADALKEQADRDRIRREAEEAAEQRMRRQLDATRLAQQQLWTRFQKELEQTLKGLQEDIKRQLIEMSIRISEILLCHELPDADMVRSILTEVLSPISDLQGVRVRVPRGAMGMLTGDADTPRAHPGVECVEDPELKPGDVLVESRNGVFDGRLSMRLNQLAQALSQPPVDETAED